MKVSRSLYLLLIMLLYGSFVYAQEMNVETFPPTPTTIRTGESFSQTYRVSFIEAPNLGRKVMISIDELKPASFPAALGDFEVIGWELDDSPRYITEFEGVLRHVWYVTYTLRVINQEKSSEDKEYAVPSITFKWAVLNNGKVGAAKEFHTEKSAINYVTTVTAGPIGIRDRAVGHDYSASATLFWTLSRIVAPLAGLLVIVSFVWSWKRKAVSEKSSTKKDEPDYSANVYEKRISLSSSYRALFRELRALKGDLSTAEPERRLAKALRDVLVARLKLKPGAGPSDVKSHIEREVKPGIYKESLTALAVFYAACQSASETKESLNIGKDRWPHELRQLERSARCLKAQWLFLAKLRHLLGMSSHD